MKIYIVTGDHYSTPGSPTSAHFDKAGADAAAFDLIGILWKDIAALISDEEELPAAVPDCWGPHNWKVALRLAKIARIEWLWGEGLSDEDRDDEDKLSEAAECDVRIEEIVVADPADDTWAHPVTLKTMEAYRQLATVSRELLDAFGGDTPDWIQPQAETLENAVMHAEAMDPGEGDA